MATAVANSSFLFEKKKGPDAQKVRDQLEMLQFFYNTYGIEKFAAYFLWILGKREDKRAVSASMLHSRYVPFIFNPIQSHLTKKISRRNITGKPRQVGMTTFYLIIRCLLEAIVTPGTNSFLVSQNNHYAAKHFVMLKRAFKYIGAINPGAKEADNFLMKELHDNLLHTTASNSHEIILDQLDNFIGVGSAEVEEVGQGLTLHRVVCSEVARWPGKPEETLANLKEAIVMDGTIDLESTPNGAQGYFFEEFIRAQAGLSDFTSHFYEWWWDPSYRVGSNDTIGVDAVLSDKDKAEMEADLDADERRLKDKIGLMFEQIAFRRAKKLSLRHNFDEKYPEDPVSCFMLSGSGFFDKDILKARYFELVKFVPDMQTVGYDPSKDVVAGTGDADSNEKRMMTGCVFMKRRIPNRRYVIGADPASGKLIGTTDTDYSSAKVIDLDTGEHCASYVNRLPPIDFAVDLAELGRYYNNALIAVERGQAADSGGEGGTVITALVHDCNYGNVYKHKEWLKRAKQSKTLIEMEGMPMNGKTRPIALNRLKYFFETYPELVWDISLVRQMMQFTRNEKGRPEGAPGCHDDEVLAGAIAHYARMVSLGYMNPELARSEKYGATPREVAEEEDYEIEEA
jgi:hypothetical protein